MNIPITIRLPTRRDSVKVTNWLLHRDLIKDVSYTWQTKELCFEHEEDAIAFMLTFGGSRCYTKVEQMLRDSNV
jgi:hypothetical protein